MAGFTMNNQEYLLRTNNWSAQFKEIFLDELMANRYVRMLDLPKDAGSSTYNIPSVGEAEVFPYTEGARVKYGKLDTGNYTFTIDQYKYSGLSVSAKFMRDSFWADQVVAMFVPKQHRAIMVDYEILTLSKANSSQTASNLNAINGANHRWVTAGTNQVMTISDFAKAQYSLKKANVPMTSLTAIVDPSVVYALQTQTNVVNFLSPMPKAEALVSNVTPTGMRFEMNIFGFDTYSSNNLPGGITETINSVTVTTNGVANYFFSAAPGDTLPWVGAWTQLPTVFSEFNKDTQEWEYVTFCEYGVQGNYRPENLVTILTDASQV